MDFEGLFSLLLIVSGLILLADRLVFRPRRERRAAGAGIQEPLLVQYARSFFPVILIVLLIRSFVVEPFRIPSPSMMPGLVDGDFIFVNKFAYGLRLPVVNTKILDLGKPQRGDVVVFRLPSNPSVHFIKRLVGLPGDHILVRDNRLTINGEAVPVTPDGTYSDGYGFSGSALERERFGVKTHVIMLAANRYATDYDTVVPEGHYFFMGDNRNDSADSRFPLVGFVPEQNLVGHAELIWMNWQIPGWPRWRRIGMKIN